MSLPKLRLEACVPLSEKEWLLDSDQRHHLTRVLRCAEGDQVEGLLSGEKIILALFAHAEGLAARECHRVSVERDDLEIHLLLALLKGDQFDIALRSCAELGVAVIHLLACSRSVPRVREGIAQKMQRWNKILHEATRQCGAVTPPRLHPPVLPEAIEFSALPESRFAALLAQDAAPLGRVRFEKRLAFAVGPEGDWDSAEEALLLAHHFQPVNLGGNVLRSSTAVAAGCSWFRLRHQSEKISDEA